MYPNYIIAFPQAANLGRNGRRVREVAKPSLIAIDGPAASGKSTIGWLLAQRLGYIYFDTGALYRAVTWAALARGVEVAKEEAVKELAEGVSIDVERPRLTDGRLYTVYLDGEDITWQIRQPEVEANVSLVSSYTGVREALLGTQRRIGERGKVVMVGRDIGTVILPNADLKIYLEASLQERARRRYLEVQGRGEGISYEEILQEMRHRDELDTGRDMAPLRVAPDAIVIDTEGASIEEILAEIEKLVEGGERKCFSTTSSM